MGNGGKIQINLLFYKLKFWSDPYVFGLTLYVLTDPL